MVALKKKKKLNIIIIIILVFFLFDIQVEAIPKSISTGADSEKWSLEGGVIRNKKFPKNVSFVCMVHTGK